MTLSRRRKHCWARRALPSFQPALMKARNRICYLHGRTCMAEYSKYQQKVIQRYYDNRDTIALQRAGELVTELYLATGKKRQKHWDSLALHLGKLGVKPETLAHLRAQDKPEL